MSSRASCLVSLATLALPLILTGAAVAQIAPPPTIPTYPPSLDGPRVKGLSYDASISGGGQSASFSFTADSGGGTATNVNWWIDNVAVPAAQGSLTYTYKAVGVGKHTVLVKTNTAKGIHTGTLTFAAIGGPLALVASTIADNPTTYLNDHEDATMPVYVQYFGYSHSSPPTDSRVEKTQDASASIGSQLSGTSFAWSYGSMYCPQMVGHVTIPNSYVTLQAEASGQNTVGCTLYYTDPVDSTLYGTANDDTADTPINPADPSVTMVNKVSAHKPNALLQNSSQTFQSYYSNWSNYYDWNAHNPGDQLAAGYWIYGTFDTLFLEDELAEAMPGVWVQERFTSNPPTYINGDNDFWTSLMPPNQSSWNTYPAGILDGQDVLACQSNLTWTTYSFTPYSSVHEYWAATKVVNPPPTGGIIVGNYTIHYMDPSTSPGYPYQNP